MRSLFMQMRGLIARGALAISPVLIFCPNDCFSQCKDGVSPVSGQAVKWFQVRTNGIYERIVLSRSGEDFKFGYINKINNDPTFKVKTGDTIRFEGAKASFAKVISESMSQTNGYSINVDIRKEDLLNMVELAKISFPTNRGEYEIKMSKSMRRSLLVGINCLYR